jgi:signal transduction histidine kinase
MFLHRINIRLIILFVGLVVAIFIAAGWVLQWTTRQSMETELGRKLEAVSGAASVMFREEEVRVLLSGLGPRTEPYFREPLLTMKKATGAKRIYFFSLNGENLLDTEKTHESRGSDFALQFYRREVDGIRRGEKIHSILFRGIDGLPTMTGFAPLLLAGRVAGGVAVDGSATFLESVEKLKHRLYWIGLVGVLIAGMGAAAVAATLTRPIRSLAASSARIGEGQLNEPIFPIGKSEIALLAKTMEEMRIGLIEREHELKAMLAGVAHEIRNPLGGIELFTGLLSDEVADRPKAKIQADRISNEVQSLKQIVDSFLVFAKPEEPKKETVSTGALIRDSIMWVSEAAQNQKVVLDVEPALDGMMVRVDPGHFKRIVLNLVQNALQAMPQGGTLRIGGAETGNTVRIGFSDSGRGIPEEARNRVFMPFFTTKEKGTGLGLSIVRKLLELNGGTAELVRTGPEGTEFCITLEKGS